MFLSYRKLKLKSPFTAQLCSSTLHHCENTVLTIFFFKFTSPRSIWEHSDFLIDQSKKIKWLIKINELTWQLLVPFLKLSCCDQKLLAYAYVHITQFGGKPERLQWKNHRYFYDHITFLLGGWKKIAALSATPFLWEKG